MMALNMKNQIAGTLDCACFSISAMTPFFQVMEK